jgi:hypothetical protein
MKDPEVSARKKSFVMFGLTLKSGLFALFVMTEMKMMIDASIQLQNYDLWLSGGTSSHDSFPDQWTLLHCQTRYFIQSPRVIW